MFEGQTPSKVPVLYHADYQISFFFSFILALILGHCQGLATRIRNYALTNKAGPYPNLLKPRTHFWELSGALLQPYRPYQIIRIPFALWSSLTSDPSKLGVCRTKTSVGALLNPNVTSFFPRWVRTFILNICYHTFAVCFQGLPMWQIVDKVFWNHFILFWRMKSCSGFRFLYLHIATA